MKKALFPESLRRLRRFAALCLCPCLLLAAECGTSGGAGDETPAEISGDARDPGFEYVTGEMIDAAFTLDFSPLLPEP
jgi:hypothetical protein